MGNLAQRRKRVRGSALIEFALTALPLIFAVVSMCGMAMTMWNYHTLAQAVKETVREAAVHGADCLGDTCAWTLGTAATYLSNRAVGIPPGSVNVTFTSQGSTQTCNPLNTCTSSTAAWPTLAANVAGTTDVAITATYTSQEAVGMFTSRGGSIFSVVNLSAKSRQMVEY